MTDLFEQNDQFDENKDYYEELVGEGRKFKDNQALAKSKYLADVHIRNVEKANDELRKDYLALLEDNKTRANLEQLADQIAKRVASSETPQAKEPEVKSLDTKQIEDLVSQKLREQEISKTRNTNLQSVQDKLKETFGNNYQSVLNDKMKELGLNKEMVNVLAESSPKAFFSALGLDTPRSDPFQVPPRSSVFQPTGGKKERTWQWYQDLKKSDPKTYYDPKTWVQMEKDYLSNPRSFEDGDYKRFSGDSVDNTPFGHIQY